MVVSFVLCLSYLCPGNMGNGQKVHQELFLQRSLTFETTIYCRACAASDMGLSASVPLPIVMGIFVLLGFQSS